MTENHDYNAPEKGTTDWHIPLNENFRLLDTDVEIRDRKGNLGNYTPNDGAKFHAIDTGEIYLSDGTNWNYHGIFPKTDSVFKIASEFDDATDGILAAMNDAPSGKPVTVFIPRGGGSGPNGEYVVEATEDLTNTYIDANSNAGVKVDRSNVWFVSDGAQVTGASGAAVHSFFIAAFDAGNETNPEPSSQVENIHLRGIVWDGKGRDNIAVSTYESSQVTFEKCIVTNWSPTSTTHFDPICFRAQHKADQMVLRNCIFKCNTNIKAYTKYDGVKGGVIDNCWYYVPDSATEQPGFYHQEKVNNDHNRAPVANRYINNVIDYRFGHDAAGGAPLFGTCKGLGDIFAHNYITAGQNNHNTGQIRGVMGRTDLSGKGAHVHNNTFVGTNFKLTDMGSGTLSNFHFYNNICINMDGTQWLRTLTQDETDLVIRDCTFRDNVYWNASEKHGSNNQGGMFEFAATDIKGCSFIRNKTYDAENWAFGTLPVANNLYKNNAVVEDPPSVTEAPTQRNKGTEEGAIPIGSGDGTGQTVVTVSHGLDFTPAPADIHVTITNGVNDTEDMYVEQVRNIGATSFDVLVVVESVSGTSGATADLSWRVDATPDWAM